MDYGPPHPLQVRGECTRCEVGVTTHHARHSDHQQSSTRRAYGIAALIFVVPIALADAASALMHEDAGPLVDGTLLVTARLPQVSAAIKVVPEPPKTSRTSSPGREQSFIASATSATGLNRGMHGELPRTRSAKGADTGIVPKFDVHPVESPAWRVANLIKSKCNPARRADP
jgi:hypothetical protein